MCGGIANLKDHFGRIKSVLPQTLPPLRKKKKECEIYSDSSTYYRHELNLEWLRQLRPARPNFQNNFIVSKKKILKDGNRNSINDQTTLNGDF